MQIFFPVSGAPLKNKYSGPCLPTNYIIQTPDRWKDIQLVHVNLIKKYGGRTPEHDSQQQTVLCLNVTKESTTLVKETNDANTEIPFPRENTPNSEVLRDLPGYTYESEARRRCHVSH